MKTLSELKWSCVRHELFRIHAMLPSGEKEKPFSFLRLHAIPFRDALNFFRKKTGSKSNVKLIALNFNHQFSSLVQNTKLTSLLKNIYRIGLIIVPLFAKRIDIIVRTRGAEVKIMAQILVMAYGVQTI